MQKKRAAINLKTKFHNGAMSSEYIERGGK